MGDSKLVINWVNNKVENIFLQCLLHDIQEAMLSFEWISFSHVIREINSNADAFSKEALELFIDLFCITEFVDGEEHESMNF